MLYALCAALPSCVPLDQQVTTNNKEVTYYNEKRIRTYDHIYEKNIKTVLFYPFYDTRHDVLQPPVIFINQQAPLVLEFDELGSDFYNYNAKILHCDADWSISLLNEMEYLYDYNEFMIEDYQLSFNTRQPYIHYRLQVAKVKLPGNYVLLVYREDNENDLIISSRFMVYENHINIIPDIGLSTGIMERKYMQQVNFNISYHGYDIAYPREEIKVVVRQNHRWDNAIYNLKPLYVRENEKLLEFNFFDLENNFNGGNEYRIFDISSIRFLGLNIKQLNIEDEKNMVTLLPDKSRRNQVYSEEVDINGKYFIDVYEFGNEAIEADYVYVIFTLHAPVEADGNVYIFGGLSEWKLDNDLLMIYDPEKKQYSGQAFLKQGYYNYEYVVKHYDLSGARDQGQIWDEGGIRSEDPEKNRKVWSSRTGFTPQLDESYFEGSYYSTENIYDILVYYRPVGSLSDLLLGYVSMDYKGE